MKVDEYISKIIEETALPRKEIQDKMEKKKEELKGLISDEGALFLIAKELGVNIKSDNKEILQDIEIKVSDITLNMKNITLVGRIKNINNVNKFNKKDGGVGFVGSFVLHDTSGDIRIVLWDEHNKIMEDPNFDINALVKIINGYPKKGRFDDIEINIGKMGKLIVNPEDIDNKKFPKMKIELLKIKDIKTSAGSVNIEGQIVQKFPIKEFIKKKDGEKGRVGKVIVRDNSGSITIVFWNDDVEKLDNLDVEIIVSITNLTPKISTMDNKTIELTLTKNSQITKKAGKMKFEEEIAKNIQELQNMQNIVSFRGIVTSIDNVRKITLKSGEEMDLLSFDVSDDTDSIRVVVWGEKAKDISETLQMGKGVLLKGAMIKYSKFTNKKEISFSNNSIIESIELEFKNLKSNDSKNIEMKQSFSGNYTKINDIKSEGIFEIKGSITKELKNITIYEACKNCSRKIENCKCASKGEIEPRMILNAIIDDESGTIRTTFVGEKAENLLGIKTDLISKIKETPDFEKFLEKASANLVGKDIIIKGRAKYSEYSQSYELSVFDFKDMNVNQELEKTMNELEV